MKKSITCLFMVIIIMSIFCLIVNSSQAIDIKDYVKDKFPSVFSFYLSSLEELDQYEKEFIDLLQELPEEEQEYYAKEVYRKKYFSLKILEEVNCAYAQHTRGLDYYTCLGEYAKAIEAYKEAVRINPDYANAHNNMGLAYYGLREYNRAINIFKEVIRIDPDFAFAHYMLAIVNLSIGEKDSALDEYKILKELNIDLANKLFDLMK